VLESSVFDIVHEGDHDEAVGEEDIPPYTELSGEGQRRGVPKGVAQECRGGAAHHEVVEVEDRATGELKHDGAKADVHQERLLFLS
jgi:hypothetical protein